MAVALTEFLKHVQPEVMGCPQPIALEQILRACIDFCARSRLLDETTTVTTVAGTATYAMTFASGLVAHDLVYVRRDTTTQLNRSTREDFDASTSTTEDGEATSYYMNGENNLVLGPIPNAVETLDVKAVVKPVYNATTVPTVLLADWFTEIAAGAKAKLYAQKNTAWYDPIEAAKKETQFSAGVRDATHRTNTGKTRALIRVQMRPAA